MISSPFCAFSVAVAIAVPVALFFLHKQEKKLAKDFPAERKGESGIRRSTLAPDLVKTLNPSVTTMYSVMTAAAAAYPNKQQYGQRTLVKMHIEEKTVKKGTSVEVKKWSFPELSSYTFLTYAEIEKRCLMVGAGLVKAGAGKTLGIFAPTSREWSIIANSCWSQGIAVATAYDSLGPDGLAHALNEGSLASLFTTTDLLAVVRGVIPLVASLKLVVYIGDVKLVEGLKADFTHVSFLSIDEVASLGKAHPLAPSPPTSSDPACIMYTSGSTGSPKGVVISHCNLVSSIAGASLIIGVYLNESDVYLAYLPLAHILEMLIESACFSLGVTLGFGSPRSLADASVRNCKGDMKELKPTIMAGVPSVWETIRKGVLVKVNAASPVQQWIFNTAVSLKIALMKAGLPSGFLDFAFAKIKDNTGGRLRLAVSGGAPIPRSTHSFLSATLCPILQGYGMTESTGVITIQTPEQAQRLKLGECGPPSPSLEVKLVDCTEMNYLCTHLPNPQGELHVRGNSITAGYFLRPELNLETITQDGWLKTGDIAEFLPNGSISIIDRKKNLVKLSNGEYIALEKLESVYKSSGFALNLCVYADPESTFAIAVMNVIPHAVQVLVKKFGISDEAGMGEVLEDMRIKAAIFGDLVAVGKGGGLKGSEVIGDVVFAVEDWTPQNGFLTAAMKINRNSVIKAFAKEIEAVYK